MAIGQNTFWIVVDRTTMAAVTPPDDKRVAIRFISKEAAEAWRDKRGYDWDIYMIVKVPA